LSKVIRDSSNLDTVITPFVDAANSKNWKHALNILYLNGAVLEIPEATSTPCLVSQVGTAEATDNSLDLLASRSQTRLMPLIIDIAKLFIPRLLSSSREIGHAKLEATSVDQSVGELSKIAIDMSPELEKLRSLGPKLFLRGAFSISDLIVASLFKTITEIRNGQTSCGIKEADYERMVEALSRLDVVEPILQISVCSKCANYQFTVSTCPAVRLACPKCGENWTTQTVYMFKGQLSKIKAENQDLPLFISGYLKHKTSFTMIFGETRIYPNAQIETQTPAGKETVEVDVYIPDFHIGIECKSYTNPETVMTKDRLHGMAGDIVENHVKKYAIAGIEHIFIITNLPENQGQKLEKAISSLLENQNVKLETIRVIPGRIEALLQFLNGLAETITQRTKLVNNSEPETDEIQEINESR